MIKCVISDMGNVFLSFDNDIFFKKMAEYSPYSFSEIKEFAQKNLALGREFDKGEIAPDFFCRRVQEIIKAELSPDTFFELYNDIFTLKLKELDILDRLQQHHRMVLLSNTDIERYGFIQKAFPRINIFDVYVLSFQVGLIKPDPRIYIYAVDQAGVLPRECIFIDDLEENTRGAGLLGINTIHYTPQTDLAEELRRFQLRF